MANYRREILIPYLLDVYSTELLYDRLGNEVARANADEQRAIRWANMQLHEPIQQIAEESSASTSDALLYLSAVISLGIGLVGGIRSLYSTSILSGILELFMSGLFLMYGIPGTVAIFVDLMGRRDSYENAKWRNQKRYEDEMQEYQRLLKERENARQYLTRIQPVYAKLRARYDEAAELRDEVYDVNIIPSRYRNKYAAYYLYDYFTTSQETDLDRVIQTFLLDEIRARLDQIIVQQQEIILNQREFLAQKAESNQLAADRYRENMQHIARLEANQEMQEKYLEMIEENSRTSAYFATATYIRDLLSPAR